MCLSLLGTFSGPSWEPGRSTLLQLLLSIQALVFNAWPYENEPCHEGSSSKPEKRPAAAAYNAEVRLSVLRTGMTGVLRAPPRGFESAVAAHFAGKASEIRGQALLWCEEAVLLARVEMEKERYRALDVAAVAGAVEASLALLRRRAGEIHLKRGGLGGSDIDPRGFTLPPALPKWVAPAASAGGMGGSSSSSSSSSSGGGGGSGFVFGDFDVPAHPLPKHGKGKGKGGSSGALHLPERGHAAAAPPAAAPYAGPRSIGDLCALLTRVRRVAAGATVAEEEALHRAAREQAEALEQEGGGRAAQR